MNGSRGWTTKPLDGRVAVVTGASSGIGAATAVNMASTAGARGVSGLSAYAAAKHGVIGLSKVAALDYADRGIRVNVVAPGRIASERIAGLSEEQRQPIVEAVPMRRIGSPEDVA